MLVYFSHNVSAPLIFIAKPARMSPSAGILPGHNSVCGDSDPRTTQFLIRAARRLAVNLERSIVWSLYALVNWSWRYHYSFRVTICSLLSLKPWLVCMVAGAWPASTVVHVGGCHRHARMAWNDDQQPFTSYRTQNAIKWCIFMSIGSTFAVPGSMGKHADIVHVCRSWLSARRISHQHGVSYAARHSCSFQSSSLSGSEKPR